MDGLLVASFILSCGFLGVFVYGLCVIRRAKTEWDRVAEGDYR